MEVDKSWKTRYASQKLPTVLASNTLQQIEEIEKEFDELQGHEEQVEVESEFDSGFAEKFSLENIQNWKHNNSEESKQTITFTLVLSALNVVSLKANRVLS